MNFGSLFSGIGGLDLAMEACGHSPLWQIEMETFCNRILETHWPKVQRYTDIRDIDWRTVPRPELICGGFPCQPFSVAGENRGEDDERNMWPETYRAVRELGPRYVFLENVPGLLAHEYFGTILGDLAEDGYDAVWDTFTAAEVGAPHRRERLFILAYARQQQEHIQQRRKGSEPAREGVRVAYAGDDLVRAGPDLPGGLGATPEGTKGARGAALRDSVTRRSSPVGHTEGEQRQGRAEPEGRAGEAVSGRSGAPVADATGSRQRTGVRHDDAGQPDPLGPPRPRRPSSLGTSARRNAGA